MLKKIHLYGLSAILSMALFGCSTTSDNVENSNEGVSKEEKETPEITNTTGEIVDNESTIVLNTGPTETVIRNVEGMDLEVNVLTYQIQPYGISYQLDEILGVPEVEQNQITYSTENDEYKIKLEMIEHTTLEKAVSNIQEKFEKEGYEEKGELESTSLEENDLNGKMQYFMYPMKGFYAYEMDEHVLVITYQYPVEGGDGMHPLLEDLRKTINVQ